LGHVVTGHGILIGPVLAGIPQLLGTAVVGLFFHIALNRTAAEIHRSAGLTAQAHLREHRQHAREALLNDRLQTLESSSVPLLRRIAQGPPFSDADRKRCARAELEIRDRIVAPALSHTEVIRGVRAARERGVDVSLQTDEPTDLRGQGLVQRIVVAALESARSGSTVKVHWHAEVQPFATVAISGPRAPLSLPPPLTSSHVTARVTHDVDSTLVEVSSVGT
jgi:hypothetical protein